MAPQESNVSPGPRAVTPGNQYDVLHVNKTQSKPLSEGETAFDMFNYPLAKIPPCNSVLALSSYRKEQYRAVLPPVAQICNL
jgi:hypothetical protein